MSTALNLKDSLRNSRVLCPGLCEIDYQIADALSEAIGNQDLYALALVNKLALIFTQPSDTHPILQDSLFITQIIDAIATEEYADEFRTLCKNVFDWDTTKRFNVTTSDYKDRPYIDFAANWWTGRIQRQITTITRPNGEKMPRQSLMTFTPEMINRFYSCLANEIAKEIDSSLYHTSRQKTEYWAPITPGLRTAADLIGIKYDANPFGVFPGEVIMDISEDSVIVDKDILWQKR